MTLTLRLLPQQFAIVQLEDRSTFPAWLPMDSIFFLARTEDEFSLFCPQDLVPQDIACQDEWNCLRVDGDLAFDEIGVVARVSKPLADAGISLFLISTYDRDYVFFHDNDYNKALRIYRTAGFTLIDAD